MRILVPIADRKLGFRALDVAIDEAKLRNWKVVVMCSLPGGDKTTSEDVERAENLLNEAVEIAKSKGLDAEKVLSVRGKGAGEDIVSFSEEIKAEMIVMGCGIVKDQFTHELRDTTKYVILNSKKPVILVK